MSDESCQRFKGFKITPNYTHQQKRLHKKRRLLSFHWYMLHEISYMQQKRDESKGWKTSSCTKKYKKFVSPFPLMCGHFLL